MRDRIKLLAEQAGCGWWEGRASRDMTQCQTELEKFAELIVRECATFIVNNAPVANCKEDCHLSYVSDGYTGAADLIKEYFGVE